MHDPTTLTARELSRRIAAGELSPIDVIDAHLAKIHALDGHLGALLEVYDEEARAEAARAHDRARRGLSRGPLHGLPIAVKDLFAIAGRVTTAGSLHWTERRAESTAGAVLQLTDHGAIVLGKTHTAEFGLGTTGTNQRLGTPRNPWGRDTHVAPGGSSSGSAVAVAAGLAPWALGTDTGGSIRIPAAWCGVVGLKTTYGQISLEGVTPLAPTLDSVGAIARTVGDAALLYAALRGGPGHVRDREPELAMTALRIGCLPAGERARASEDVLDAHDEAVRVLRALGATVSEVRFPRPLDHYLDRNSTIALFEAAGRYGPLAEDPAVPLDDRVRWLLELGGRIDPEDHRAAVRELPSLRSEFDLLFDRVDALVTPTTQTVARPVAGADEAHPPNVFTRFVNLLGLCAIAVPCGFSPARLPCSLQIVCRADQEPLLLRIAAAYEAATGWHRHHPPACGW